MRLGLHANSNNGHGQLLRYVERVIPNMVKLLDPNRQVVDEIRRASGGKTKVIGRKYWSDQTLDQYGEFRAAAVDLARDSGVDYMEGYNEWGLTRANASSFAGAEVGLAKELNKHGIGAMIGGFSTGYLDQNLSGDRSWTHGRVMFDYLNSVPPELGLLHFHEYSHHLPYGTGVPPCDNAPWPEQWDHQNHRWTGFEDTRSAYWDPARVGWWTLRYRRLRKVLLAQGYKNIGFAITEFGCDDVNPRPCGHGRGWRDFTNCPHFNDHRIGDFVDQVFWFMWQVSHDPYVYAVTDFGFATVDPAWLTFDFSQTPTEFERLAETQRLLPFTGAPLDSRPVPVAPAPVVPTPGTGKGAVPDLTWIPGRSDSYAAIARQAYAKEDEPSWAKVLPLVKALQAMNGGRGVNVGVPVNVPGIMQFANEGLRGLRTRIQPGEGPWPLVRRCYNLPTAPASVMGPIVAAVKYANPTWVAGGMVDLPGRAVHVA